MKHKFLVFFLIFFGTINSNFAQNKVSQILDVEKKVERYIEQNIDQPLPEKDFLEIIAAYNLEAEEHGHGPTFNELSAEEQKNYFLAYQRENLRYQYFKDNPKATDVYRSAPAALCDNGDFELGDFTHYEGQSAWGSKGGYRGGECSSVPVVGVGEFAWSPNDMTNPDEFKIVSAGFDPIVAMDPGGASLSTVNPYTANNVYAARINSPIPLVDPPTANTCSPEFGIDRLTKTFVLEEDGVHEILFYYALVSETPMHGSRNPFFLARALDDTQTELDRICVVSNPDTNPFFEIFTTNAFLCPANGPANIVWQDWTCEKLEVSGKAGSEITLEFIMADCAQGRHFGYAYVDDICIESCASGNGDYQGSIDLDPLDPCQEFSFDVCGEFTLPQLDGQQGTVSSISLQVLQNGSVVNTLSEPTITGNEFCFEVAANDFPSQTGGYDLKANVTFEIAGGFDYANDTHTAPGQNNDYIFDNPACCDLEVVVSNIQCDDQGTPDAADDTWSFDLTAENPESNGSSWVADGVATSTGAYGVATNISMGNISDFGATVEFNVYDSEVNECTRQVQVSVPEPCSELCSIEALSSVGMCSDNGTPLDPTDDFYNITLDVLNSQGEPWMVLNSAGLIIYFGFGDENNVDLGNYLVADQSEWFWIKLSNDPSCSVDVTVLAPESCNFSCNIQAVVSIGECDDNGTPEDTSDDFYFVTVNVLGTNGLPWQLIGHPNGQTVSSSGTGNTTNIVLGPIGTDDSSWPLYIFSTDPRYSDCRTEVLIHAPKCAGKKASGKKIFISPNPNNGQMNIRAALAKDAKVELNIFRFDGTLVKSHKDLKTTEGVFNINYQSNLPKGLYYFHFRIDEEVITRKVIIE